MFPRELESAVWTVMPVILVLTASPKDPKTIAKVVDSKPGQKIL